MCYPNRLIALLTVVLLIAGCSSDSDLAVDETTATSATTTTTVADITTTTTTTAAPSTTAATTTTALDPGPGVDEALAPSFVEEIRKSWERTERTVGGTAPDLSDDEIVAIGTSVCEHLAANPLPAWNKTSRNEQLMEAYSEVSAIICEAMGMPYDPALQDAGFESELDARAVIAFTHTLEPGSDGGLCPVPTSGPGSMPCSLAGCDLFASPWSAAASA